MLLLLGSAGTADAAIPFCLPGSGAGQCSNPQGVAVDTELERVYIVDRGNNRINVFETDGDFVLSFGWGVDDGSPELQTCTTATGCQPGSAGFGAGQFSGPFRIAVDNDPASLGAPGVLGQHAIYVGTDNFRVQKFNPSGEFERTWGWDVVAAGPGDDTTPPEDQFEICVLSDGDVCKAGVSNAGEGAFGRPDDPIAVGPGGIAHVGDKLTLQGAEPARIEKFEPSGAFAGLLTLLLERRLWGLAVDSIGDIYTTPDGGVAQGVHKYHPDGTEYGSPYPLDPSTQTTALAIGPADSLFAAQSEKGFRPIALYDVAGATLSRFGYEVTAENIDGLAPFESPAGDVFAEGGEEGIEYLAVPPPGPIIPPSRVKASAISNTKATLEAEVNPEGKATTYRFDYLTQEEFEEQGGFEGPTTKSTTPASAGSDFFLHLVKATIGCPDPVTEAELGTCLLPDTEYRFRVVATNADDSDEVEGTFTTAPPIAFVATWSTGVGVDAAKLHAEVNPLGIPATAYFEYVDDATFQVSGFDEAIQAPNVEGGETPLDFGGAEAPVARSASIPGLQPGTTYHYRVVATNPLLAEPIIGPELTFTTFAAISEPPEACANEEFRTEVAAFLADCRAYEMASPLEKNSGDILPLGEFTLNLPAALELASTSGERLTYGSYRTFGKPEGSAYTAQYLAARDEDKGWLTHNISPPRGAPVLRESLALHLDTEFKTFSPDLCQAWIRAITEPQLDPFAVKEYANLYRRTDDECAGGKSWEALTRVEPPDRPPEEYYGLELQGVSADGSHAIYVAPDNLTEDAPDVGEGTPLEFEPQLYEWDGNTKELRFVCILPGEVAHTGSCSAGTANNENGDSRSASVYNAISADGSRIFWTASPGDLGDDPIYVRINGTETRAVSEEAEDLESSTASQYWTAARDGSLAIFSTGGGLYSFNVNTEESTEIAPSGLVGVMGASEDASRIYFASNTALTGEEVNGNGDKAQAGNPNLYLYEEGATTFIGTLAASDVNLNLQNVPVAVQPRFRNSRVSADGEHAAFGSAASLTGYDNIDAVTGEPAAEAFLYDAGTNELICASCNPTGARPRGIKPNPKINDFRTAGEIPVWWNTLHASRVLAEDGSRLYFQSSDVLTARDTNGVEDVYQWEEEGTGTCDADDPGFSPDSGGCIELISSGKSQRASEFVAADPSGKNVFIRTLSSLVPQDYGLIDIYDARVGGGFPPPDPPPAPCEGEACQSPPPPPQAPTPSSSNQGPGNVKAEPKPRRTCPKGKRRVSKGGKERCVKKQKRAKRNNRRAGR